MFDKRLLESSELYEKRYKNFAVLLIFPIAFLCIGIFIFSFFAKKELVVTSIANIEPQKIIANIQSTSNNPIVENYLVEGKAVQANSLLLKYNSNSDSTQIKNLLDQKQNLLEKKEQLQILLNSLSSDKNEFQTPDTYGYEKTFENYMAQASNLREAIRKSNQSVDDQNTSVSNQKMAIEQQISHLNTQINFYIEIQNAVSKNNSISSDNPYTALYSSYVAQRKLLEEESKTKDNTEDSLSNSLSKQKENLKTQFIADISSNINNLKEQIQTFTVQKSSLTINNNYDNSQNTQLLALKTQFLTSANKELADFNSNLIDLETKINLQKQADKYNEIFAENEGILHVFPNVLSNKNIQTGTTIAQIYPPLTNQTSIHLVTYIPSSQISGIKIGQKARFIVQQNLPKTTILTGKIQQIDSAPTLLKDINAYKVTVLVTLNKQTLPYIRYGLEGKITIVTGQKVYFNYYLDKLKGTSS